MEENKAVPEQQSQPHSPAPAQADSPLPATAGQIKDRNLGDEWAEWVGDLSEYEKELDEGKGLFLGFYFISLFVLTSVLMFIYYLIAPRLYQLSPLLDKFVLWAVIGGLTVIFVHALLLYLSLAFNKRLIPLKEGLLDAEKYFSLAAWLASLIGLSKDKIGNSMVKVHNALVYADSQPVAAKNLLVLLPRCLDRETREKVTSMAQGYGATVFSATGGSSARQMIRKTKPDAIIGVACERDLVAGISDTPKKIRVIGIANKRPFGPCKDTTISADEFERAIKFLLKV